MKFSLCSSNVQLIANHFKYSKTCGQVSIYFFFLNWRSLFEYEKIYRLTKNEGKTNLSTNRVTKLYLFQLGAYKKSVIQHGLPLNCISKKSFRELKLPVVWTSFLEMYIPIKHPMRESENRLVPIVYCSGSKLKNSIWHVTFATAIC